MHEVIMCYSGEGEDSHGLERVGELVRCKNCTWFRKGDCINTHGIMFPDEDDFCSWGSRRRRHEDNKVCGYY